MDKTNAMRILDQKKIKYTCHEYEVDENIDGISVAEKLGEDPNKVFKTLVTVSKTKKYYVFVVPVNEELDLKKCAKAVSEKSIEMIPMKDLLGITGYIRGGCSPLGMKKVFPTVIDEYALLYDTIIFSGGKRGLQIEMDPNELNDVIKVSFADIKE